MEELPAVVKQLIPVISLILGWLLREVSGIMESKREEKQVLSRAVAELLEIHSDLSTHEKMFRVFDERYDLTSNQKLELSRWLIRNRPRSETIEERFDETAKRVASVDPIISHAIRLAKEAHSNLFEGKVFESEDIPVKACKAAVESERDAIRNIANRTERYAIKISFNHSLLLWAKLNLGFIGNRPDDDADQKFLERFPRLDSMIEERLQKIETSETQG